MLIEPHLEGSGRESRRSGWIEVICGSMFSGKTEELIRRLNRAVIAGQKVEIFKPAIEKRYHDKNVVSHNDRSIRSTPVQFADDVILLAGESQVVGIDEAQFFDDEIVNVSVALANKGKRVILAGLDMDFMGKPFGCMPQLMGNNKIMLGEKEAYEARCRKCFWEAMGNDKK